MDAPREYVHVPWWKELHLSARARRICYCLSLDLALARHEWQWMMEPGCGLHTTREIMAALRPFRMGPPKDDWWDLLPLSVRSANILRNSNLSLEQAIKTSLEVWKRYPNCGPLSAAEIVGALQDIFGPVSDGDVDWW